MFTAYSLTFFLLVLALLIAAAQPHCPRVLSPQAEGRMERRAVQALAFFCIVLGVAARLYSLSAVPEGLSAQDALVGANASALLTTGKDITGRAWPALIPLWAGRQTGAFTAYCAVPFIRLMGLTLTAIRLPSALLGVAGIAAFYFLVKKAAGSRQAACASALFALSPFAIMGARWAVSDFSFLNVLLFALALGAYAEKAPCLIGSLLCFALLPYTHAAGVIIALPGALSVLLLFFFRRGFKSAYPWVGAALFCVVYGYAAVQWAGTLPPMGYDAALERLLSAFRQTFLQYPLHENLAAANFSSPSGMLAYPFATVAALAGCGYALHTARERLVSRRSRGLCVLCGATGLACLVSICLCAQTDIFSACVLMPFFFLAVAAGVCLCMKRIRFSGGALCLCALLSFAGFAGAYYSGDLSREEMNGFFPGFMEAAQAISDAQQVNALNTVYVSADIYPHEDPENALRLMIATGFDAAQLCVENPQAFAARYRPVYDASSLELDASGASAYMLRAGEAAAIDTAGVTLTEFGDYLVLLPAAQ